MNRAPALQSECLYLSWESPWPTHSGAALRSWGLLNELSKAYSVDIILLTRHPLTRDQEQALARVTRTITRLPLPDTTRWSKARIILEMIRRRYPYHSALLEIALQDHDDIRHKILQFPGIVFTNMGHWGTLVFDRYSPNWILNQCDADVDLWRVYADQATHPLTRLAARINYRLAYRHYPRIYNNVGHIISVCDQDRQHTLRLASKTPVSVIENGIDCSYYVPNRQPDINPLRILFTGTSAPRNMIALHEFVRTIWPLIRSNMPDVEFLVGGNFSKSAQAEFSTIPNMRFTGRVEDMRPLFDQSTIFVAPFRETHGSKLKVAEAMAMGMPIVSTPEGVRGFPAEHGKNVLVADDAETFARCCVELLRDPEQRRRLGEAARQTALEKLDWPVLGLRLRQIVRDVAIDAGLV